jgi:hypothetical protein
MVAAATLVAALLVVFRGGMRLAPGTSLAPGTLSPTWHDADGLR